jgi:hypothetical protein
MCPTIPVDRIDNFIERLPPETLSRLVDGLNEIIVCSESGKGKQTSMQR